MFRMNATFVEVLKEVRFGLLITEPDVERNGRIRRGSPRTLKRIPNRSGFALFRCHSAVYLREREREKKKKKEQNTTQLRIGMKRKNVCMKNAWTCDVQTLKASWAETQSNLTAFTSLINYTILKCMKHCYNVKRMKCRSI